MKVSRSKVRLQAGPPLVLCGLLLGLSLSGPSRANDPLEVEWHGGFEGSELTIGGHGQVSTNSSDASTDWNSNSSGFSGSNSISFEQLPPPDVDAPHLPNSGAEGLSDLDSKEPPIAAAPGVARIDPATLISISDVQRLAADAGRVSISPNRGWVYVNKPVYFSTDAVDMTASSRCWGSPSRFIWCPLGIRGTRGTEVRQWPPRGPEVRGPMAMSRTAIERSRRVSGWG